jgi:hypothetical protein
LSAVNGILVFLAIVAGVMVGLLINYLADVLLATRLSSRLVCPYCNEPYQLKDYVLD